MRRRQPRWCFQLSGSGPGLPGRQVRDVTGAAWSAGDWNFDGLFNSQDLVVAFQQQSTALAKAKKEVPIKGSLQGVESYDVPSSTLFVDGSGSGNAAHLGRFTVSYESEVYIPMLTGSRSAHFIADNGNSLLTVVHGQASPTENRDVLSIVETYTSVVGSGRFDGASGEFTVWRSLNSVTGVTSGSFDGTIIK